LRDLLAGRSIAVISEAACPASPIREKGSYAWRSNTAFRLPLSRAIGFCFCRRGVRPRYETICLRRFHPARGSERRKLIEKIALERRTVVFYEAPHRIEKLFRDLLEADLSERYVVVARELTKRYEEFLRFTVAEAVAYYETVTPRGEFTIVLEGPKNTRRERATREFVQTMSSSHY